MRRSSHALAMMLVMAPGMAAAAIPRIRTFSPVNGPPETVVRIVGSDLNAVRRVLIGGAEAGFRPLSATSLQAAVPTEAVSGPIVVIGEDGADTSRAVFAVEPRTPSAGVATLDPSRPAEGGLVWKFTLPRAGKTQFGIYDLQGVRVRVLVDGPLEPGAYERLWDGKDAHGRRMPGGLCFAVLEFEGKKISRLSVLMPQR